MSFSGLFPKIILAVVCAYAAVSVAAYAIQDKLIYYPNPAPVGEPEDARVNAVSFDDATGNTIVAWYGPAKTGCPTFIFLHGNASRIGQDPWRYKRVLDKGAGLLAVSWPGYAGSGGKPGEEAFHAAADAAFVWALGRGIAEGDLIIHGNSIGTGPAAKLASEHQVGALILEAPYFSMLDLIASKAPVLPVRWILKPTFRTDKWITDVRSPVMMAHGTVDSVIPQNQSRRLFEQAHEPKLYESFEGSEHSTLVRDGLYDRVWPFLENTWAVTRSSRCFSDSSNSPETTT